LESEASYTNAAKPRPLAKRKQSGVPTPLARRVRRGASGLARKLPRNFRDGDRGKGEGRTLEAEDREDARVFGAAHAAASLKRPARGTGAGGSPSMNMTGEHGARRFIRRAP